MPDHDRRTQLILVRHGQSEGNVAAEAAARDELEQIEVPARDPYVAEALDEEQVLARARDTALSNASICRLQQDPESPTGWDVTDYNLKDHLHEDAVTVTEEPSTTAEES